MTPIWLAQFIRWSNKTNPAITIKAVIAGFVWFYSFLFGQVYIYDGLIREIYLDDKYKWAGSLSYSLNS